MLRSTCFLYMIVHNANIFHATLHMSSFLTWLYVPLASFMLRYACLLYVVAHTVGRRGGLSVKNSFQTVSIQRMQGTNFWMLRYGSMSTNGNGDTRIVMPCGKWCPRRWKNFAHEMLHLGMWKVKGLSSLPAAVPGFCVMLGYWQRQLVAFGVVVMCRWASLHFSLEWKKAPHITRQSPCSQMLC